MTGIKALIKAAAPGAALQAYRRVRIALQRIANNRRSAREVFSAVYARNVWGGAPGEFCSGSGSAPSQARAYVAWVRDFIGRNSVQSVVDLGCGDYGIGRLLRTPGDSYIGVDVVPALIQRNRREFGASNTEFACLDIASDELPAGDICLIRQVLQHLSNAEITAVLAKLRRYRFVLVTEHYPAPGRLVRANVDKSHGGDTRVVDGSAVCLDAPPFMCLIECVLDSPVEAPLVAAGETIRTFLVRI